MNSYKYLQTPEPEFEYDYVDPGGSAEERNSEGWLYDSEYDYLTNEKYEDDDPYDDEEEEKRREKEQKELGDADADIIRKSRIGTYYDALNSLKQNVPGHANMNIYVKPDWSDIPDNTYDIVYAFNCPVYKSPGGFEIRLKSGAFPFNNLLQQSLRVLKPGGFLIVPRYPYKNKKGESVYTKISTDPYTRPSGFQITEKNVGERIVSSEFPEFWTKPFEIDGYDVKNGKLVPRKYTQQLMNAPHQASRKLIKWTKQSPSQEDVEQETLTAMRTGGRKTYRMPRKYSKSYCRKTTCKKMGFTQRSSCRPYKNCFRSGRK